MATTRASRANQNAPRPAGFEAAAGFGAAGGGGGFGGTEALDVAGPAALEERVAPAAGLGLAAAAPLGSGFDVLGGVPAVPPFGSTFDAVVGSTFEARFGSALDSTFGSSFGPDWGAYLDPPAAAAGPGPIDAPPAGD